MRSLLFIILVALAPFVVSAQKAEREVQAEYVKAAIAQIATHKKPKVEMVLRDLREVEGQISSVDGDFFIVRFKKKKAWNQSIVLVSIGTPPPKTVKRPMSIKYVDVLQLVGKGVLVSFVPDPQKSPYSTWDDVEAVGRGEFLQVHLKDGKKIHGVLFKSGPDSLSLMRGNTERELLKEDVVRVYRVTSDTSTLAAKIFGGGKRGADVAEQVLPILDASAHAGPFGLIMGTAIGVGTILTMHVLPKGGTKRVLVYSK